jgi:hypothetical protein
MMMRAWIRQLFAHPVTRTSRRVPHSSRPAVEVLEQRCAPSATPIIKPGHTPASTTGTTGPVAPSGGIQLGVMVGDVAPGDVPAGAGHTPDQLRTAYGINGITFKGGTITGDGSGQTIAIVDPYNDPNIVGDLDAFDQNVYLSASAKTAGTTLYAQYGAAASFLTAYDQNGNVINPATENTVPNGVRFGGWAGEISLDVEWAHAIAPGARIDLVECASNVSTNLYTGAVTAGGLSGVSVVSMSWGSLNFPGQTAFDGDFVHQGVTFVACTLDSSGLYTPYPATSPNVLAVGGTTLNLNANNTWQSETAWYSGGGGTSISELEPAYQDGVQDTGSRTTPDVSFDANPSTGVAIYDSYDYGSSRPWIELGGTSLGAPSWAALLAIANQGRMANGLSVLNASGPTQTQTLLYGLPGSDFHDITSGNNFLYAAGPGYDEATGLGTPIVSSLVPDLAAAISISPGTLPQGQLSTAYSQTLSATGGIGTDTLSVTGLPPGLGFTASPNQLVISGTPTAPGTYPVTITASDPHGHTTTLTYDLRITQNVTSPIVVTNTSNLASVTGSLPWAVAQADSDASGQPMVIDFASGTGQTFATPQTITLTGTLYLANPTPGDTITINGPAAGVTIQGGGGSSNFSVVTVSGGTTATINGVTISDGHVSGNGGGIANFGTLLLTNDTIAGNSANSGGGLFSDSAALTVTGDTFDGNSATIYGGGIFADGVSAMTNSTLTANSAEEGGGIFVDGGATVTNCTIAANSAAAYGGGGLWSYFTNSVTVINTIVADNSAGGSTYGVNLGGSSLTSASTNDLDSYGVGVNPLLAPLRNYGGPTETMALLPGSPAIDAGTNGTGIPATDQRGLGRVGAVDIGAFESRGFTLTPVTGSTPQTSPIGTPFANPLAVTVTANNWNEPVNGGVVSFTNVPNGSALAILSASTAVIASGQAAVIAEPDNAVGSYQVDASASGASSVAFALTNAGPAFTSLVVNTTNSSLFPGTGLLSLPEAVAFANFDSSGVSTIGFDKNVFAKPQTITLTGNQLEFSNTGETETINGPKAGVTVNAGGLSRALQVDANVTASVSGLTMSDGIAPGGDGGGVYNAGSLSMANCTISGNSASYGGGGLFNAYPGSLSMTNCTISGNATGNNTFDNGGGLVNTGSLSMANCTVSSNTAYGGCGIYNAYGATANLSNCTVTGNSSNGPDSSYGGFSSGGGVGNGGSLTMTGCTVTGNSAVFGGGLYNTFGTVSLTNCTVSGNTGKCGGGGVFNFSAGPLAFGGTGVTMTSCTVSGNDTLHPGAFGGGAGVYNGFGSALTMSNCSVSGNTDRSDGGGGVLNAFLSTAVLTNCTITGNSTTAAGGGVFNMDANFPRRSYSTTTTLNNCTVSGNSAVTGGGIANQGVTMALNVTNCVINNNRATSAGGGISTTGGSVTISNTVINANQVNSHGTAVGGGIDCEKSVLSLTNCTINANQANGTTALGGGIYALGSTVDVQSSTVNGNKADGAVRGEGGGIYSYSSALTLVASYVDGNKASTAFDDIFKGP